MSARTREASRTEEASRNEEASRTDEAWRKAANCARLVEQVDDDASRHALTRMRNSWIAIANEGVLRGALDGTAILHMCPDDGRAAK